MRKMLFFLHYLNRPAITKFVAADLLKSVDKSNRDTICLF